jgi:hypothetical protein
MSQRRHNRQCCEANILETSNLFNNEQIGPVWLKLREGALHRERTKKGARPHRERAPRCRSYSLEESVFPSDVVPALALTPLVLTLPL